MTYPPIDPCAYCGQSTPSTCDECGCHACGNHADYFQRADVVGDIGRLCYDCIDVSVEGFSAPEEVSA